MSRNTSHATDQSERLEPVSNEQVTRPLPRLTPFDLEAEARRLDALACALDDSDSTLMIGADENRRLLATSFALAEASAARPAHDDEPTVAARAPHLFLVPSLPLEVEVEPAPETLRMQVSLPAAALPPPSGERPRIPPALDTREIHAPRAPRTAPPAEAKRLPQGTTQTWTVVAIWALALSLFVLLMLLVRSA